MRLLLRVGVPKVPKAFVGSDKAFHAAASIGFKGCWPPGEHQLQNTQQLFGNLQVHGVTGVVERHQDLVRKPARMAWQASRARVARQVLLPHGFIRVATAVNHKPPLQPYVSLHLRHALRLR